MSRKTTIQFEIDLDDANVPDRIVWAASDMPEDQNPETRSISVSIWDPQAKNTLRIDLWTKEMTVPDMKRFYIDSIGGLAQSVLEATGDEKMANDMKALCDRLVQHVRDQG